MATNVVCSDTYVDAFSKLDKKAQKKSLETIREMQRSLKSDGLKVEKLNTKLDFKSARVTQDYRVIFTQAGNTVLLVYVDHHDDAYAWATRRLQGFNPEEARPASEYFESLKKPEEKLFQFSWDWNSPSGGAQCVTLVILFLIVFILGYMCGAHFG